MLIKLYWSLWIVLGLSAVVLYAIGSFTMLAAVYPTEMRRWSGAAQGEAMSSTSYETRGATDELCADVGRERGHSCSGCGSRNVFFGNVQRSSGHAHAVFAGKHRGAAFPQRLSFTTRVGADREVTRRAG